MKSAHQVQVNSILELQEFVKKNLQSFVQRKRILLLEGEMGSGKTEFVKQLVNLVNGDLATSPSFAIHNSYQAAKLSIEHIDLYRLTSEDDLQSVGFWELFENENSMIIIEWSNKIDISRLPFSWDKKLLKFATISESARSISFD